MIKLIKSTFYNESKTKELLCSFVRDAKILSMGAQCGDFEKAFARKQGRKYAVFVSSGSAANLILIQALLNSGRLKKGDNVAFSALTWATNVMPLIELGLNPLPLDCELSTLNVSKEILKNSYTSDLKALFITNVLGFSSDIEAIENFCNKHNILFLEDNCESLGSKVSGKLLGNFGVASTFSTFVGHHLSTIEGGFVCTDDTDLYGMLLMVRAHGWDRNLSTEKKIEYRQKNDIKDFYAKYTFYDLAYNTRPTEIEGFIGNSQIGYWDEIVEKRAKNFSAYQNAVESNPDIYGLKVEHMDLVSNFSMPVVFKNKEYFEEYKRRFEKAEVEIRPIIAGNITKQPFYKKYVTRLCSLENSDLVHDQGFYFPNNPELTEEEVSLLCDLISGREGLPISP
ncbi:DegT/DnrJ/EryC1/StrS family aminotransferase [Patescibacteria group bacterium]|nr:DegT/DnrJ/EryC1/StrS family aminotransferase [Patescibacteria group bacterium]